MQGFVSSEKTTTSPHILNDDWATDASDSRPMGIALDRFRALFSSTPSKREQLSQLRIKHLEQHNARLAEAVEQLIQRVAKARYLANHDGLTGLCNRSLLMDRFVHAAAQAQRSGSPMALLLIDLDGFKLINDQFGHMAGDRLLQRVSGCLQKIARAGDTPCRYGGDEFLLLLPGVPSMAMARRVEKRIHQDILSCLREDDIDKDVSASCGIALYPGDGENWNTLMSAADAAMYRSKPKRTTPGGATPRPNQFRRHDRESLITPEPTASTGMQP
ncbi:MAG: GGDEF domain-containing protein [Halothiobacillus sp.]|jgi:diguanylate cyclase (GGDEF)-like protein|nr:GGDEF domain-containing protein [Halothiobacillus sp.]